MGKLDAHGDEGRRNEKGSLRRLSRAKQKRFTDKLLQTNAIQSDHSHFDSVHNHFTSSDIARQCNLEMT